MTSSDISSFEFRTSSKQQKAKFLCNSNILDAMTAKDITNQSPIYRDMIVRSVERGIILKGSRERGMPALIKLFSQTKPLRDEWLKSSFKCLVVRICVSFFDLVDHFDDKAVEFTAVQSKQLIRMVFHRKI